MPLHSPFKPSAVTTFDQTVSSRSMSAAYCSGVLGSASAPSAASCLSRALGAGHRQRAQRSARDMAEGRGNRAEHHRDMAAQEIGHGRSGPPIRNMDQLEAGRGGQQLSRQMADRANAGRAIVERAGMVLGIGDQLGDRVHRQARMHHQHGRRQSDPADGCEVLARIKARTGVQARADRQRAGIAKQERVAVGRAARDRARPDRAAGAAAVLDHDRLAERLAHLLGHDPPHDRGRAAGWERHHQRDRAGRIVLCRHPERECGESEQDGDADADHGAG